MPEAVSTTIKSYDCHVCSTDPAFWHEHSFETAPSNNTIANTKRQDLLPAIKPRTECYSFDETISSVVEANIEILYIFTFGEKRTTKCVFISLSRDETNTLYVDSNQERGESAAGRVPEGQYQDPLLSGRPAKFGWEADFPFDFA